MCYALPVMLWVPQHHPGHKPRGRGSCAISERSIRSLFASFSLFRMLSPIIPVHPQKQGGGGVIRMVTYLKYVGAPTFLVGARRLRHSDERSLQGLKPALLAADCRT